MFNSTNTTSPSTYLRNSGDNIIIFALICIIVLLSIIFVLFAKIRRDSCLYSLLKYIKVKFLLICCCCFGKTKDIVEKNLLEMKEQEIIV